MLILSKYFDMALVRRSPCAVASTKIESISFTLPRSFSIQQHKPSCFECKKSQINSSFFKATKSSVDQNRGTGQSSPTTCKRYQGFSNNLVTNFSTHHLAHTHYIKCGAYFKFVGLTATATYHNRPPIWGKTLQMALGALETTDPHTTLARHRRTNEPTTTTHYSCQGLNKNARRDNTRERRTIEYHTF